MAAGDTWLREHPIAFSWYQDCPPFETDIQDPLVQTLADAAGRVTGKRVISGMTAGCDARHLTNIAKVPTVVRAPATMRMWSMNICLWNSISRRLKLIWK